MRHNILKLVGPLISSFSDGEPSVFVPFCSVAPRLTVSPMSSLVVEKIGSVFGSLCNVTRFLESLQCFLSEPFMVLQFRENSILWQPLDHLQPVGVNINFASDLTKATRNFYPLKFSSFSPTTPLTNANMLGCAGNPVSVFVLFPVSFTAVLFKRCRRSFISWPAVS